jgi:hypothetical protein
MLIISTTVHGGRPAARVVLHADANLDGVLREVRREVEPPFAFEEVAIRLSCIRVRRPPLSEVAAPEIEPEIEVES